jgi:hypothetical protein
MKAHEEVLWRIIFKKLKKKLQLQNENLLKPRCFSLSLIFTACSDEETVLGTGTVALEFDNPLKETISLKHKTQPPAMKCLKSRL